MSTHAVALFVFQYVCVCALFFFFSSRRRHTRFDCDWRFRRVLFRSRALTSYPADLVTAPPQVSRAEFRLRTGDAAARLRAAGTDPAGHRAEEAVRRAPADGLTRLIGSGPSVFSPGLLLAAFAGAPFWGAAHALSPGHGKTIVAAYLVGQRGAPLHAVWLGLIVTFTHTAGVFALGGLTLLLSRWFVPESLYPWLGFASGLTVAA